MADFSEISGTMIFLVIVVFGLMMYIVTIQTIESAPQPLDNNSIFNNSLTQLQAQINNATAEADSKYDVFNEETPQPGFGSIILFGIVSIGKTFSAIIFGIFAAIIKLPLIVFGIPASTFNLIITWLIIIVVVAVWRLYKLGG